MCVQRWMRARDFRTYRIGLSPAATAVGQLWYVALLPTHSWLYYYYFYTYTTIMAEWQL